MFIDRDGRHFHHILNFLRNNRVVLPKSEDTRQELLLEAQFFQLAGLIEAISGEGRFERELGPLNLATRERETRLRTLFAQNPASPELTDPHVGLIDIFAHLELFDPAADQSWQQVGGRRVFEQLSAAARETINSGLRGRSVCDTFETFRRNFHFFTRTNDGSGLLDGLDFSK